MTDTDSTPHPSNDTAMNLSDYQIPGLPDSFYYVPNFITAAEEAHLLSKIQAHPFIPLTHRRLQVHPARLTPTNILVSSSPLPPWLTNPILPRFSALKVFEGTKHGAPNHCLVNEYLPGQGIMPHEDGDAYACVVGTVSLGGAGVLELWRKDGRGDEGGGGGEENGQERDKKEEGGRERRRGRGRPAFRILQERRSLLVTRGEAYQVLLHGISERRSDVGLKPGSGREGLDEDECEQPACNWELIGNKERFEDGVLERETRVSLTYRDVLRVSNVGMKLFGKR